MQTPFFMCAGYYSPLQITINKLNRVIYSNNILFIIFFYFSKFISHNTYILKNQMGKKISTESI